MIFSNIIKNPLMQMGQMLTRPQQQQYRQSLNTNFPVAQAPATIRRSAPLSQGNGSLQGLDGGKTNFSGLMSQQLRRSEARQNGKSDPYRDMRNWQETQAQRSQFSKDSSFNGK